MFTPRSPLVEQAELAEVESMREVGGPRRYSLGKLGKSLDFLKTSGMGLKLQ